MDQFARVQRRIGHCGCPEHAKQPHLHYPAAPGRDGGGERQCGYQPRQTYGQPDYGMQQPMQGMQYGNVQQPMVPQMEYGQQYQAPAQNAQAQQPQNGAQPQQAAQQPAAGVTPAPAASTVERDDLGVPAFLRRPTRK